MHGMILVVDANLDERQELCRLFEQSRYQTASMQSLAELLKHLQESSCHAVILDLDSLPVDNRFIRDLCKENPYLCVIGISGRPFHPELEEAIRTAGLARLFKQDILDELDKELKEDFSQDAKFPIFSRQHIQAIVDLVNKDDFISRKGQEMDLTLQLAITLDGTDKAFKFNFEKGKIIRLDEDLQAPFIISAPLEVWQQVFLGRLDCFVAVTQGKMKLKGELGKLSRWYVPFSRLFELFKKIKIAI